MKSSIACFNYYLLDKMKMIKRIVYSILLGVGIFLPIWTNFSHAASNCSGIKLNTDVPFIGNCIYFGKTEGTGDNKKISQLDAFPYLISGLMKIVMTAILVISFVLIVVAGVMISASGISPNAYKTGMKLIEKVAIGIALLGASGVILKIINPNFFV